MPDIGSTSSAHETLGVNIVYRVPGCSYWSPPSAPTDAAITVTVSVCDENYNVHKHIREEEQSTRGCLCPKNIERGGDFTFLKETPNLWVFTCWPGKITAAPSWTWRDISASSSARHFTKWNKSISLFPKKASFFFQTPEVFKGRDLCVYRARRCVLPLGSTRPSDAFHSDSETTWGFNAV